MSRLVPLAVVALLLLTPGTHGQQRDKLEANVDRALSFLHKVQDSDGGWHLSGQKSPAAAALAVMAFLSAGHVPGEGPYSDTIEKGVRWVLKQQHDNGSFANNLGHEMYQHGICTLMLAEVAGMTQDVKLGKQIRKGVEEAVKIVLQGQRTQGVHRGGWRYQIQGFDADLSVTGWQLLALRAAKNLGCDVPTERISMAVEYVKRSRDPGTGGYCYMPGGGMTIPCTGTGILCLEICGKHHLPEALQAGSVLLKQPPQWNDPHFFYAVYYCSQATFQLGNNYWNFYRPKLHKELFDNQQDNGCWMCNSGFGPVYGTATAVLALTVEYRYLPIYQRGEEPGSPKKK